jgi:signal peptidase II
MAKLVRFAIPRFCLIFSVCLSTLGCDQVTKAVARDTLHRPLSYLGGSVILERAQNPGAFLNLGVEWPTAVRFWIFSVGVAAFLLVCAIYLIRQQRMNTRLTVALSLLLAGGTGNLIDRLYFGSVTDFLNVGVGNLRTGIFNVADMAIVLSLLILLVKPKRRVGLCP